MSEKATTNLKRPLGIHGIRSKRSVGVVITIGVRSPAGTPTGKDRFFFMMPQAPDKEFTTGGGKKWSAPTRDPHPEFATWNTAAKARDPSTRVVYGNLVHFEWKDAFEYRRRAFKLSGKWENPPDRKPACEGDGKRAVRYFGKLEDGSLDYREIECPNELCEFAQSGLCKPWARLYFRLRFPHDDSLPSLITLWSTTSWNSIESFLGLLEEVLGTEAVRPWEEREKWIPGIAASLRLPRVSLFGLPFTMVVSERTKASEKRRFPVVDFSADGDLLEWLMLQRRDFELAGGTVPQFLPPSPSDEVEREFEDEDYAALSGGIPSEQVQESMPQGTLFDG